MNTIFKIFIILIVQNHLRTTYAQNIWCQKIDFNRPTSVVNEFGECTGVTPPNILKINSYSASTILPFRPSSEFHLSAVDGLSCLLSTSIFTLDIFSEIRTAIFLSWDTAGAWVKVQIYDSDGDEIDVISYLEESNRWIAYYGRVNRTIENAQIEISTNSNGNGMMAVEYLFVLNSEFPDDECVDEETEPIITDPTDESPTEPTDLTGEPTNDPTERSTKEQFPTTTSESPHQSRSVATNVWMGLSILFIVTFVITFSSGFCYFIWLYRRILRSMIPVTVSGENDETGITLPRLQVKSSVIDGDSVIVGIKN